MSDTEDQMFETGNAGASQTYPMQAGGIKKNAHVMIKGHPCKVVDISTSKTGKHGHAKAHIVGLDIFTGKKYEDVQPTSHNMEVPIVKRTEYQIVSIDSEDYLSLLLPDGSLKDDLRVPADNDGNPDEVGKQLKDMLAEGKSVLATILTACDTQKIVAVKELT